MVEWYGVDANKHSHFWPTEMTIDENSDHTVPFCLALMLTKMQLALRLERPMQPFDLLTYFQQFGAMADPMVYFEDLKFRPQWYVVAAQLDRDEDDIFSYCL